MLVNKQFMAVQNSRLYEDLNKRIENLQEKNEIIKFFAYSVSHDLKSPATGIYGLAKHLNDNYGPALEEKGREHCHQIMKAAERLVEMVDKINAFIIAKEAPLDLQKINMREITEILQTEFSARLWQQNIVWIEAENFPEIIADKLAILRVFRNLIDNALKYGGDGMREIKIGYDENDDFHIFSFSDDGVGIKKEGGEMIFGPFKRMKTSRGMTGAGLGLAIVREIVQRHGGLVWMDNATEKGTLFYFSISKALHIH
jgi:light-regulated signal transduction histidine kinase (bacteriophytochrome)